MNFRSILNRSLFLSLLFTTYCLPAPSADNIFFYRATYFPGLPRLERKSLTTFEITAGGGGTTHARNCSGDKTCLLNYCGPYNMHLLGQGVPDKDMSNPQDTALNDLALLTGHDGFGQLSFAGKFTMAEVFFEWTQNIVGGFFIDALIPFRSLKVTGICAKDLSPLSGPCPTVNTPEWQTFLNQFDAILNRYHLSLAATNSQGMGDASFYVGWTTNYQDTEDIDFFDATFKLGVLVPSAQKTDIDLVFAIPLGNQQHLGIPATFDMAIGMYDWLTFGLHASGLAFVGKKQEIRMKTDSNQNGLIILAQGQAQVIPGTKWLGAAYVQADHFFRGLSVLAGYSFAKQNRTSVSPCNKDIFNACIAESACPFQEWSMHTLTFGVEYDFTRQNPRAGLRMSGFYNLIVGGKRIFNTGIGGGLVGIDANWSFH